MRIAVLFIISLSLTACTSPFSSSSSKATRGDFCKIEGSAIGHEGFVLTLGNRAVHFHNWVAKQGSPGEYVGFSISLSGTSSLGYVVKAGTQTFHSTAATWLHPDGQAGHAISHVSFCENCEDGDCGGGGGGGGSDECTCDENGENCTDGSEDGTLY